MFISIIISSLQFTPSLVRKKCSLLSFKKTHLLTNIFFYFLSRHLFFTQELKFSCFSHALVLNLFYICWNIDNPLTTDAFVNTFPSEARKLLGTKIYKAPEIKDCFLQELYSYLLDLRLKTPVTYNVWDELEENKSWWRTRYTKLTHHELVLAKSSGKSTVLTILNKTLMIQFNIPWWFNWTFPWLFNWTQLKHWR